MLQRELVLRRKAAAEALEDMYVAYQPRIPTTKDDGTLRELERELNLTRLEEVGGRGVGWVLSLESEGGTCAEGRLCQVA